MQILSFFLTTQAASAIQPLPLEQADRVSGGCSNPRGCTQLYRPATIPTISPKMFYSGLSTPPPPMQIPTNWHQ